MATELQSTRYDVADTAAAVEFYFDKGWTDGLPVVPPTENAIWGMLESAGLGATGGDHLHRQPPSVGDRREGGHQRRHGRLQAGIHARAGRRGGGHGRPLVELSRSGNKHRRLGGAGGGERPHRAGIGPQPRRQPVRPPAGAPTRPSGGRCGWLCATSSAPCRDASTAAPLGHSGKYSFCIAENEAESPWPALHVERGFKPEQNAVTILAALAPHQFYNQLSNTAEGILTTACAHMRISAGVRSHPQYVLVLAGEHMQVIGQDGWSKDDIRRFCFEHTHSSAGRTQTHPRHAGGDSAPTDETAMVPLVPTPEDFLIVAAGSRAGAFSAFIPGWGSKSTSQSVTREIRRP